MLILNRRRQGDPDAAVRGTVAARADWPSAHETRDGNPVECIPDASRPGLFSTCANAACKSGWLRLWRSHSGPVFEGGWSCSPECTSALLEWAVWREMEKRPRASEPHRQRIPLGLMMLEQGWITQAQLRSALEAQRAAGSGRLGYWLIHGQGVSEQLVTKALGLQWNCPVLEVDVEESLRLASLVPRLFVDAFGVLPLRAAAGRILYLGFEDRLDPVLALAAERMTGLRVESGLVADSLFGSAHTRILRAQYPRQELIEATSETALVQALVRRVERSCPVESRLVRVHDCLWLRLWKRPQKGPVPEPGMVEDVICSLRGN